MDTRKRRKEGNSSSQSFMLESLQSLPKRAKVHAQRKFAQGTQPSSPALTPVKEFRELRDRTIPTDCRTRLGLASHPVSGGHVTPTTPPLLPSSAVRPKTEDFLTFLCFRRTTLLPPELEFFETPQLLDNSASNVDSNGITPPQDDKNVKPTFKKKEDLSFGSDKGEKKLGTSVPKETFKRNLEQIENESQNPSTARVTRSSASLTPTPSFLSSPPSSDNSPENSPTKKRLTRKQMLLKKAMLIKSQKFKDRRRCVQAHLRSKAEQRRNMITRSDSLSIGPVSPMDLSTRTHARKSVKAKALLRRRKKEQISRVLKRLGAPLILSPTEEGRITRSRTETCDDSTADEESFKAVRRRSSESNESSVFTSVRDKKQIKEEIVEKAYVEDLKGEEKPSPDTEQDSNIRVPRRNFNLLKKNLSCKDVLRKRKNAVELRATRRLLQPKDKEKNSTGQDSVESISKQRCTRSASDTFSIESGLSPEILEGHIERSKSCDERVPETKKRSMRTRGNELQPEAESLASSVSSRPKRRTKQVAELYLELISHRLAKESQKGKELSDEDMEEDTISISCIKELKALSKSSKNKDIDIEKCMQEIAEKHEKESKDALDMKESKLLCKEPAGKRLGREKHAAVSVKPKIEVCDGGVSKRGLRSNSLTSDISENIKPKSRVASISPVNKHRSSSPQVLEDYSLDKKLEARSSKVPRTHHRDGSKSPRLSATFGNDKPLRSLRLQASPSTTYPVTRKVSSQAHLEQSEQLSVKPEEKEEKEIISSPRSLRKRASSEIGKLNNRETVRRLSYDSKLKKGETYDSKPLEKPSNCVRRKEPEKEEDLDTSHKQSKDSSNDEVKVNSQNTSSENKASFDGNSKEILSSLNEEALQKEKEDATMQKSKLPLAVYDEKSESTTSIENSVSEYDFVSDPIVKDNKEKEFKPIKSTDNNLEDCSFKAVKFPKKAVKPKCLPLTSPRPKRTLSLDSDQCSSFKSIRLKKKFGSLESVINDCDKNENLSNVKVSQGSSVPQSATTKHSKSSAVREPKQKGSDSINLIPSRKSIFSRRRSSIHDEEKLNAVLESVAKDFEKDMDDQLYDKIEKDLNSGNKSPDKVNRSLLGTLKSNQESSVEKDTEKEISPLTIDVSSRGSPVMQSSSASSSPISVRKSNAGKKLCDVVRNLQERKQAESPQSYTDSDTPPFLQDLKSLDLRNTEKPKQVSEEAVVTQPFDLAPAPTISHSTDVCDQNSPVNLKPSTHPCTSEYKAHEDSPTKTTECNADEKEITSTSTVSPVSESEANIPVPIPSSVSYAISNSSSVIASSIITNISPSVSLTTYIPFPSVNAEPVLNMPMTNVNLNVPKVTLSTRPLSSIRPQTNINITTNQLATNIVPQRFAHVGHGMSLAPASIPSTTVFHETLKVSKSDQTGCKPSNKQILIAPKPSKITTSQGSSMLKNTGTPKPIQIAPKLPVNTSGSSPSVGHLHSSAPMLPGSQMGHVIQGVPQVQTMQPLPQGLQTVQAMPQNVQSLQAITQNFPTIAGMTSAVQAVITQSMAINHNQLVTPSSPAKIITQPVFVTSSMPSVVGAPFDITMQNHLHSNAVARVVAQNVVGKVAPKPQASLVSSGTQSLVTLAPGSISSNVIPSIVPFHQPLQPGQPTQFVAVNMMPVAPPQISLQGARPLPSSQMGPIICPQAMTCIPSSAGIPTISTPLNIIPPGSLVTCPIPDVNNSICNTGLIQPLPMPLNTQTTAAQPLECITSSSPINLDSTNSQATLDNEAKSSEESSFEKENIDSNVEESGVLKLESQNNDNLIANAKENFDESDNTSIEDSINTSSTNEMNDENISTTLSNCQESSESEFVSKGEAIDPHAKILTDNSSLQSKLNLMHRSFSHIGTSPAVSNALSKLFPVPSTTSKDFVASTVSSSDSTGKPLIKTINISSQSLEPPTKSITSHMIFSNFVYTTTSIVIPKMSDQSMTSPKAVTKVSQSSPPYVLSTSTSNDVASKHSNPRSTKVSELKEPNSSNVSPAVTTSQTVNSSSVKLNSSVPLIVENQVSVKSKNQIERVSSTDCGMPQITHTKSLYTSSASCTAVISSTVPVSHSVSSTNTCPVSSKPPSTFLKSKTLDPKTFYSNNYQKKVLKDKAKERESSVTSTEEKVKKSFSSSFVSSKVTLDDNSSSDSKSSSSSSHHSYKPLKKCISSESEKYCLMNKAKNVNASSRLNKQALLLSDDGKKDTCKAKEPEGKNEKKREPILKKTLFRTKNSDDKKPSDAFSPINESSVYAFEPDLETPLEMTSPFCKRIRNIQPSPSIPTAVNQSTLKLQGSNETSKDSKAYKHRKSLFSIPSNDSDKKVKLSKEDPSANSTHTVTSKSGFKSGLGQSKVSCNQVSSSFSKSNTSINVKTSTTIDSSPLPPADSKSSKPLKPEEISSIISSHNIKPVVTTTSICTSASTITSPRQELAEVNAHKKTISKLKEKQVSVTQSLKSNLSSKVKVTQETTTSKTLSQDKRKLEKVVPIISEDTLNEENLPKVDLKDLESESNDSEDLDIEVKINQPAKKPLTNSTSIAIQCDLDDSQSEKSQDELRGSENGTQTEGPSKFPLPPSASPFYYLPLAMATLGEKLPAQLVQQMLAKTQGLVGAAEAGLILQQAAQLAQQYHKTSEDEENPSLTPSPVVKPISPKSGSIALQKALKANLASIAQAEISVAQSSGILTQPAGQGSLLLPSALKESKNSPNNSKGLLKVATPVSESVEKVESSSVKNNPTNAPPPPPPSLEQPHSTSSSPIPNEKDSTVEEKVDQEVEETPAKSSKEVKPKGKRSKASEVLVKRRSGRSTTLASTKATESDLQEVEELRRHRRARRAAAVLAKEESWSSSSEAPMSPIMSPDMLRGWPPPRLTSPTPSQSSEGTTASSSNVSLRSRVSAPHSRRQSPASSGETNKRSSRYGGSSGNAFSTDPVIEPGPLRVSDDPKLSRAPTFFPSEEEFTDPLDYIEKIRPEAEQFGLCRIVPPSNFRPECRVNDDMRFTAYKQYVHRMMRRWGPNDKTLCAIKKCLAKQNIELTSMPLIGGLELDLVQLYRVVEDHGGLIKVIEKELWAKVADVLRIPKSAQDRITKLDSIYCKYLLPFATLSKKEKEQMLEEVEVVHTRAQREEGVQKSGEESDDEEEEEEPLECTVKGKSTALSAFYRIARNVAGQWQPDPSGIQMDERYWEIVRDSENYICVHTASIDTSEHGYGFPSQKSCPNAKHPWNLKNLCQNSHSVLRSMGNVIGVTAPTLHVGMMFSTVCWYRDPHSLPWIEYLHTGACKIWYGVSSNNEGKFRSALTQIVPDFIKNSPLWLPSDTAMVPPVDLVEEGVKVCRVVQEPGQFVVVFPGAFTSSVCSGYLISESAFFARPQYFDRAVTTFQTLAECCEPSMFSLDRLALAVASDSKATLEALVRARQVVVTVVEREKTERQALLQLGLTTSERLSAPDTYRKRKARYVEDEEENCCEVCRQHLYVSLVTNSQEEAVYCLQHAITFLTNNKSQISFSKLLYTFSLPELTSALKQMDERIQTKTTKKTSSSCSKRGKFQDQQDSFSNTSGSNF